MPLDTAKTAKALREQVQTALGELLAAFQRADEQAHGALFDEYRDQHLGEVYSGLVRVLMRCVFVLFAEGRRLLPDDRTLTPLHTRLEGARDQYGAWASLVSLFRTLHDDGGAKEGGFFDPGMFPFLEGSARGTRAPSLDLERVPHIGDDVVLRLLTNLLVVGGERVPYGDLEIEQLGEIYEGLTGFEIQIHGGGGALLAPGSLGIRVGHGRRRTGSHYTRLALTRDLVRRTLAPLLHDGDRSPDDILSLKVCDPSMGSGAFLLEACRQIADRLVLAWERAGLTVDLPQGDDATGCARRMIAQRCLYGVDKNPLAVDLARVSLWLVASARGQPFTFVDHSLRHGDSLVGLSREQIVHVALSVVPGARPLIDDRADPRGARVVGDLMLSTLFDGLTKKARAAALLHVRANVQACVARGESLTSLEPVVASLRRTHAPFHWELEVPEVFLAPRTGFDAFVGNPPWVSYAGRAVQPLDDDTRDFYSRSPAFHGFRNLQALFVHRAATMLSVGGRIGFVLPTSMCDLAGYRPSRTAHDTLCVCDDDLPDFGETAFEGVFQPAMGLVSTRLAEAVVAPVSPWPLARSDLDRATTSLLERMARLPRLPPALFGERGFQTIGNDVRKLHTRSDRKGSVSVRTGSDIRPCFRGRPKLFCNPAAFGDRFRPNADWTGVKLLIRQTARYPMVALSDGQAFRNSILAGFSDTTWSAPFLLAYLNSNPVRFVHYMTNRDARQGMPQLKISHLRALPAPTVASAIRELDELGTVLGVRNEGLAATEQEELDRAAGDALGMNDEDRNRVRAWAMPEAARV